MDVMDLDEFVEFQSTNRNVHVLLVRWEHHDIVGLNEQIDQLRCVFTEKFRFQVETWCIPSHRHAMALLSEKLHSVAHNAGPRDLVILYYGGHATNADTCVWAERASGGYTLSWSGLTGLLSCHPFDVLYILDCCFASRAASAFHGLATGGSNWLLAASGTNVTASSSPRFNFTQRLTAVLADLAEHCQLGSWKKVTSEDVHTILHLDHGRALETNAVHVRLNRAPCDHIDLTPLLWRDLPHDEYFDEFSLIEVEAGRSPWPTAPGLLLDYFPSYSLASSEPNLDVVLVPGGYGNPYSSFQSDGFYWPENLLYKELLHIRIQPRFLAFNYHWTHSTYSPSGFEKCFRRLAKDLGAIRASTRGDVRRPILFIAYGRGCTVVRSVVQEMFGKFSTCLTPT